MPSTIVCLGYYDEANLGDECFKEAFCKILPMYTFRFINPCGPTDPKSIREMIVDDDTKAIIVGGGDLIRDFWMPKIKWLLMGITKPKLAISVGISYPDCAAYLKHFDGIIVRSRADLDMMKEIRPDTLFLPDITTIFATEYPPSVKNSRDKGTFQLGVSLARPCFSSFTDTNTLESFYQFIVGGIRQFLNMVQSQSGKRCKVHFLPFNTNTVKEDECDLMLHSEIAARLRRHVSLNDVEVHTYNDTWKSKDMMWHLCQNIDVLLGMRYHAIVFSMITKTPFVALYSQPKINNLMEDSGFSDHPCNLRFSEIGLPSSTLSNALTYQYMNGGLIHYFDTVQDDYKRLLNNHLERNDSSTHTILPDHVLLMPSEHTIHRILQETISHWMSGTETNEIESCLHTAVRDSSVENVTTLIHDLFCTLLAMTTRHCSPPPLWTNNKRSQNSFSLVAREYEYGFMAKVYDAFESETSIDFHNELVWVIQHYIRNM